MSHRVGQGESEDRGVHLGAGGRPCRLFGFVEREPAARQELEAVDPPAAGNERQLLAAGAPGQGLDRRVVARRPRTARRRAPLRPTPRQGSDRARASDRRSPVRSGEPFRRRPPRARRTSDSERFHASPWTLPDRRVASTAPSSSSAASASRPRKTLTHPSTGADERDDARLVRRQPYGHRPLGVCLRFLVAVEVELCGGQIGRGVESEGELCVGQGIDERGGFQRAVLGLRDRPGERDRESEHGDCRRGQRVDAERPSGLERLRGPRRASARTPCGRSHRRRARS